LEKAGVKVLEASRAGYDETGESGSEHRECSEAEAKDE